jgi:hypothetical protein
MGLRSWGHLLFRRNNRILSCLTKRSLSQNYNKMQYYVQAVGSVHENGIGYIQTSVGSLILYL